MESYKYTQNYCEENIWHLCQDPRLTDYSKKVLIVSNNAKNLPFYNQKSSQGDLPVWWDYHVILLASKGDVQLIFDFDSTLDFPTSLEDYLRKTFVNHSNWIEKDLPHFKSIEAKDYLEKFFSDRSHMKSSDGQWIFAPPAWPNIEGQGDLVLSDLLDFSENSNQEIFSLDEMHLLIEK